MGVPLGDLAGLPKGDPSQRILTCMCSCSVLEYVFRHAAKSLFDVEIGEIAFKTKRNKDFQEISFQVASRCTVL